MLTKQKKQKIISKFKIHPSDTGSPEVQIAILTEEIKELAKHLKSHKQDHSSRRGLLKKIGERKRLLRYIEAESEVRFLNITSALNLKISKAFLRKKEQELLDEAEFLGDDVKEEEIPEPEAALIEEV